MVDDETAAWLAGYRFSGDIDGYAEGELFFPGSPILTVSGTFAECVVLETLVLSVLNHDCAVAAARRAHGDRRPGTPADRDGLAPHPRGRGRRGRARGVSGRVRVHIQPRGRRRYAVPTTGTAAHAFTLLHDDERPRSRPRSRRWASRPRCWSTRTTSARASVTPSRSPGPGLRAIRIDSGDLSVLAAQSRELLDSLGAVDTKIVVSGDLDEYAIAALAAEPVDAYGAGTAVVTGSGAPTANLVYKLVEVDGRAVVKRSENKATVGGRKTAVRRHKPTGTATEEVIVSRGHPRPGPTTARCSALRRGAGRRCRSSNSGRSPRADAAEPHRRTVGRAEAVRRRSGHPGRIQGAVP